MKILLAAFVFLMAACGRKTVETTPVRGDIAETVFAGGNLEPRDSYSLTAQTEGYVTRISFDEGDTVKKDQVLLLVENTQSTVTARSSEQLYSIAGLNASESGPLLSQAKQNIEQLQLKRSHDSIMVVRYRNLYRDQSTSRVQLENAELAFQNSKTSHFNATEAYRALRQQTRQQLLQQEAQRDIAAAALGHSRVHAPVGGKVYRRFKQQGDYVRRGEVIAVIGSPSHIYARLTVDETSINRVQRGQKVFVRLNTQPDTSYSAIVQKILPAFDERSQSFICEAEFDGVAAGLLAGTQLQANIVTGTKKNALLIPRNYLSYRNTVRLKGKGEQPVSVGFISGEWVEVVKGLDETSVIEAQVSD